MCWENIGSQIHANQSKRGEKEIKIERVNKGDMFWLVGCLEDRWPSVGPQPKNRMEEMLE